MNGLLAGVRVLDLTRMLAGPYGTMLLGDLGAEVIKIEEPAGDYTRSGNDADGRGIGTYFLSVNRNKKSVVIDLKQPQGLQVFYDLVKVSDVVIDNFRPQALKRLKCDFEDIRNYNPRIISCSISGFGQSGPYRDRPAFDLTVQALSGAMGLTGEKGGPPCRLGLPVGDVAGGMFAVIAILSALHHRDRTGQGQKLDIGLMDCLVSMSCYLTALCCASGEDPGPQGTRHEVVVPYQAFACKDRWIVVTCVTPKFWEGFCRALESEALIRDPRFSDNARRLQNYDELQAVLEDLLRRKSADEWLSALTREGVPCAPVNSLKDALKDPQALHRQMVVDVPHPRQGTVRLAGNPIKTPGIEQQFHSPPELGGQTREILSQLLGYDAQQMDQLTTSGAVAAFGETKRE